MSRTTHAPRTARPPLLRRALLGAAATGALLASTFTPMAFADHYDASLDGTGSNLPSRFQIETDANWRLDTDPDTAYDWDNVLQSAKTDKPTGKLDDSYVGGVKEDTACPGQTTGSIPNNKSDLLSFGTWVEEGSPGYLHLYWVRVTDPSGTTLMDFEFNQSNEGCTSGPNKVRTTGDLLLEYSIVNGGSRAVMTLREWTGSAWGPATNISSSAMATGTINSTAIAPHQDRMYVDGVETNVDVPGMSPRTFGEASIDLNAIFDSTRCESYGSAMLKSRSSDSFTSQLKDFIAPVPLTLTNCGKVAITKQTTPDGATASFTYTKSFGTDPATPNTFSLTDGQTKTFDNVLFGTNYTVTENALPTGWTFDNLDCSDSTGGVAYTVNAATRTVTFSIADANDYLKCTYHNKALAKLTIVKKVTDAPGGQAFPFTSTGGLSPATFSLTPTGTGDAGAASTTYTNIPTGDYSVTEDVPAGWNLTGATCSNGDAPSAITLEGGDDVTCTFTNARERGAIDIAKIRKHAAAEGGEGPHAGVSFDVTGTNGVDVTVTTDAQGRACVPGLLYGTYTVTESVPAGYIAVDASQDVAVSAEADCGDARDAAADVSFTNRPLTNITVSVDSQIDGGTASTISCVDADGDVVVEDLSNEPGDVSVTAEDLDYTAPAATLVCTIVVDP